MNISLRQLKAFVALAQIGSFTKAAEQIHVTQAALSAMIRNMEASLHAQLFERTTRSVQLTEQGHRFLTVARRIIHDLESTARLFEYSQYLQQEKIRVGVTPFIASTIIPDVIQMCKTLMPDVQIEIMDADRTVIQKAVEQGDLDVAFGAFFNRISGIERHILFSSELMLASALQDNKFASSVSWEQLKELKLVVFSDENPIQRLVNSLLPDTQVIESATVVTHLQTILAMVEAGLSYAVVPSFVALAHLRWAVRLHTLHPSESLDYYWITRSGQPVTDMTNHFIDAFKTVANTRFHHA